MEMSVIESSNEVETQSEAFSFVSVRAAQDSESFKPRQDVFHDQTLLRQETVFSFLLLCERMMLAFLVGSARVGMEFLDSFVAAVGQAGRGGQQLQARIFEQSKVMGFTTGKGSAE